LVEVETPGYSNGVTAESENGSLLFRRRGIRHLRGFGKIRKRSLRHNVMGKKGG